ERRGDAVGGEQPAQLRERGATALAVVAEQKPGAVDVLDAARGGEAPAGRRRVAAQVLALQAVVGGAREGVERIGAQDRQVGGDGGRWVLLELGQAAAPVADLEAVVRLGLGRRRAARRAREIEPRSRPVAAAAGQVGGGEEERSPPRRLPPLVARGELVVHRGRQR